MYNYTNSIGVDKVIELRNLGKIYKSKKGSSTTALNDINLKIGNKGMLFIVGKSGSGKSTLLNLLGGLDTSTSGELLINGKNINDFNKKQYDSYRNTYIGFVFQEFNILEQYNVYENIELALKLQNKKISKKQIDDLLNNLGIGDLGNRKVNELSGGQKQRVAIARALIKNPKIILADEPTGNLDKKSSEQIFNILKEISENQLVIVVSHDMESAQKYADRIIEIEDGNVILDSNNTTDVEVGEFNLKKSKLPFLYALKMALTSFKTKPFKLFMTVLLTVISLIFMGFTVNCALFNKTMLTVNTMRDNHNYIYNIYYSDFGARGFVNDLTFNDNNLTEIKNISNSKLNSVYSLYDNSNHLMFEFGKNDRKIDFYKFEINVYHFVEINDSRILGKLIGKEPSNDREMVIHKYLADYMIQFGVMTLEGKLYFPKSYNDLVESKKEIKLGQNKIIITGIIDDEDSLFEKARKGGNFDSEKLENYYYSHYQAKSYTVYVKGFTKNAILSSDKTALLNYVSIRDDNINEQQNYISENINSLKEEINIITDRGIHNVSTLQKQEVILSIDALRIFDASFDSKFNKYLQSNSNKSYDESLKDFVSIYLKDNTLRLYLSVYVKDNLNKENENLKVVGVSLNNHNYISYQYVDEYSPVTKEINSVKIYDKDISNLTKTLNQLMYRNAFDSNIDSAGIYYNYTVDIDPSYDLLNIMGTYKGLAIYILVVSLVFVLFTFLLFSNFISISISYCKKEIGILRALGATSKDVIKIFGYESLIIGLLSWILSVIGWFIVCYLMNKSLFGNMYYTVNGIVMHPLVPAIMFIYTILIAFIITFASINRITNIKPIDAINNK